MSTSRHKKNPTFLAGCDAWGEKRDYKTAARLFQKAFKEENDLDSCYALGVMYLRHLYYYFDKDMAEKYLLAAAECGYAPAQRDLGYIYYTGFMDTMEKNHQKAEKWFSEALKQNEKGALAYCYYYGFAGFEKNVKSAREVFNEYIGVNFIDILQITMLYIDVLSEFDDDSSMLQRYSANNCCAQYGFYSKEELDCSYGDSDFLYQAARHGNPHALFLYAHYVPRTKDAVRHYIEAARLGHRGAIKKMENFWKCVSYKAKMFADQIPA